ncbi:unnamed protein product [Protopolystoma xenopodis]|uniref:Uncharacterized protein n=1 Tax=Protopolystoma xenopodis TaxID=117903 RepID=A0A3S5BWU4_9PLAT|nr:unnamed protein product [Protopolystoma xenopodis]
MPLLGTTVSRRHSLPASLLVCQPVCVCVCVCLRVYLNSLMRGLTAGNRTPTAQGDRPSRTIRSDDARGFCRPNRAKRQTPNAGRRTTHVERQNVKRKPSGTE